MYWCKDLNYISVENEYRASEICHNLSSDHYGLQQTFSSSLPSHGFQNLHLNLNYPSHIYQRGEHQVWHRVARTSSGPQSQQRQVRVHKEERAALGGQRRCG